MGKGILKQRNAMKKQFIGSLQKYAQRLEAENEQMKTDPNTVLGQLVPQFRQAITQNKRLSVLAAALIKAAGGSVTVSKEEMESFKGFALSIKWEVPEGVTVLEDAKEFVFTYEATPEEDAAKAQAAAMEAASEVQAAAAEELQIAVQGTTDAALDGAESAPVAEEVVEAVGTEESPASVEVTPTE